MIIFRIYRRIHKSRQRGENDTFTTNSLDNIKETQTSRRLEANKLPMVEIRVTEGITIDPSNNNIMAPSDDSRELEKLRLHNHNQYHHQIEQSSTRKIE